MFWGLVFGYCFVMSFLVSFLFLQQFAAGERAGNFTFIVFLLLCDAFLWSQSLPQGS